MTNVSQKVPAQGIDPTVVLANRYVVFPSNSLAQYHTNCIFTSFQNLQTEYSLGDLCHTKASLRLPLNVFGVSAAIGTDNKSAIQTQAAASADDPNELSKSLSSQNDYSSGENVVASDSMDSMVPTSCTGSMDSINSFDGGKSTQNYLNSNSTNADSLLINNATEIKCIPNETSINNDTTAPPAVTTLTATATNPTKKCDYGTTANRQSDSGEDEDSGIENIVRITKEI